MQRHDRDVGPVQDFEPCRGRALAENLCDQRVQFVDVNRAAAQVGEARVGIRQIRAPDRGKETAPLLVVVREHTDVAVLRAIRQALWRKAALVPRRPVRRIESAPAHVVAQHHLRHRLEHGDVHTLAATGFHSVQECAEDGAHADRRHVAVRNRKRDVTRTIRACHLGERGQRHERLDQVVIRGTRRVGAALVVAEHARIHDARIHRRHLLIRQSEPRHRLRPDVVHEDVGPLREFEHGLAARGFFEVEDQAALAAIALQEDRPHRGMARRADAAHGVALHRLHLHNVGPHVAQHLGGERAHEHRRQVDDAHAGERTRRGRRQRLGMMLHRTTSRASRARRGRT